VHSSREILQGNIQVKHAFKSIESAEVVSRSAVCSYDDCRLTDPRLEENSHLLQPPINNYCVYKKDVTVMVRSEDLHATTVFAEYFRLLEGLMLDPTTISTRLPNGFSNTKARCFSRWLTTPHSATYRSTKAKCSFSPLTRPIIQFASPTQLV